MAVHKTSFWLERQSKNRFILRNKCFILKLNIATFKFKQYNFIIVVYFCSVRHTNLINILVIFFKTKCLFLHTCQYILHMSVLIQQFEQVIKDITKCNNSKKKICITSLAQKIQINQIIACLLKVSLYASLCVSFQFKWSTHSTVVSNFLLMTSDEKNKIDQPHTQQLRLLSPRSLWVNLNFKKIFGRNFDLSPFLNYHYKNELLFKFAMLLNGVYVSVVRSYERK